VITRKARRQRAVLRAGVQDHGRSVCGSVDVSFAFIRDNLNRADSVLNAGRGRTERIGRLLKMHANKREDIGEIQAGDICAAVGLEECQHGRHHLRRAASHHPGVNSVRGSRDLGGGRAEDQGGPGKKWALALGKLAQEDPTFKVHTDPDSGQTIISGMG